jgi:hypothetical protein
MQGICVSGVDRERLLAAKLRVERSPGAPMANTGVMQRIRRFGVSNS